MRRLATPGLLTCAIVLATALLAFGCRSEANPARAKPSILLILTDDQRQDTLSDMPVVSSRLLTRGVSFPNAFASVPLCCPFRASLLAGGFAAQDTGVLSIAAPNGSAAAFRDELPTLPRHLQEAGYRTALIGKYLNGYGSIAPRVPPGWDSFRAWTRLGGWRDHTFVIGKSRGLATVGKERTVRDYLPTVEARAAQTFLAKVPPNQPFFLHFSTHIPHRPAVPLAEDRDAVGDFAPELATPAALAADLALKPQHVARLARAVEGRSFTARLPRDQRATLRHLDRTIGELLDLLEQRDRLADTVIIFTSDNGFLWGEHGLYQKGVPYDAAGRVPLVISVPGGPTGTRTGMVPVELDLAATIYELAGVRAPTNGQSLMPQIRDPQQTGRSEIAIAAYRDGTAAATSEDESDDETSRVTPTWAGLRSTEHLYVEIETGERELYDLRSDPGELRNLAGDPAQATTLAALASRLAPQKGLALLVPRLPDLTRGRLATMPLPTWGGRPPLTFALTSGTLPPGLELDPAGRLHGTPNADGTYSFQVTVSDASRSPWHGGPQQFRQNFVLTVAPD